MVDSHAGCTRRAKPSLWRSSSHPRIWTSLPITHRLCLGKCWSLTIRTRCTSPNISLSLSLSLYLSSLYFSSSPAVTQNFVFLIQLINFSKSLAFAIRAKRDTHRHHTHHLSRVRMHHKASL